MASVDRTSRRQEEITQHRRIEAGHLCDCPQLRTL